MVGSALACRDVARPPIQVIADKFTAVITEFSASEAERADLTQRLDRNVADGSAGFAGVAKAFRALGVDDSAILRLNYQCNTVDADDAVDQLNLQKPPIKAVVIAAVYPAAAKFIEKTHDFFPGMIYTNVSGAGGTALADELILPEPRHAAGAIVTQAVPTVSDYSSVVLEYKNALAKYFPGEAPDYVSLPRSSSTSWRTCAISIRALRSRLVLAAPNTRLRTRSGERRLMKTESTKPLNLNNISAVAQNGRSPHRRRIRFELRKMSQELIDTIAILHFGLAEVLR